MHQCRQAYLMSAVGPQQSRRIGCIAAKTVSLDTRYGLTAVIAEVPAKSAFLAPYRVSTP
jgi:hypothetical protein